MKQSRSRVFSALLSAGIIVSSIGAPAYAGGKKDFIPKVTAIDSYENPSFVIGELSEKSGESPEKIVEKNYSRKLKGSGNLKQNSFKQNKKFINSMGRTVISTTQTFNGVRVYGTDQNFHINDNGVIECVAGSKVDDIENKVISKSFSAKYSQKDVLNAVEKDLGFKPDYDEAPKPEIILYPVGSKYDYVYEVKVKCVSPYYVSCTYYVNAYNLSIIKVNNNICSVEQPATGTGIGQLRISKPLKMVRNDDSTYSLKNTDENFGTYIATTNMRGQIGYGDLFSEPDNNFDSWASVAYQDDAVDAHYNVTKVVKFFRNAPFYRDGNDGLGSELRVGIITNSSGEIADAYGDVNYVAFNTLHGTAGRSTSCCLDIVAHEYAHGILNSEGMQYAEKEERAIHEGVSDVFGVLGEHFITNDGSSDDWYIGEDMGQFLRDCANPEIDDYNDYNAYLSDPNYDPHKAGGVITKAASLMAMGGTHNGITVNMIGYEKLARIFYNVVNDGYLTSNMSLKQFANYAVQSAYLLYGINSQAYQSTRDAFIAVGLFTAPPTNLRLIYVSDMTVQLMWNATPGSIVGVYRKGAGTKDEPELLTTTTSTTGIGVTTLPGSCDFYVAYVDASGNRISAYSNALNIEKLTKSAPTNFRITYRSGLSIQFSWNGAAGERYAVYRKISGTNDEFKKVGEITGNQISVETLLGKCDFKVAVVSQEEDGIRLSPFSNVYSIETYLNAPDNFRVGNVTTSTVEFLWDEETAANRYAVYRTPYGTTQEPEKVAETKDTSLTVYTTAGRYNYQAAIVDLEGNRISSFSNIVNVQR